MSTLPNKSTCLARCANGHRFGVAGVYHWNPWGEPDFEVTGSRVCPECGGEGNVVSKADRRGAEDEARAQVYAARAARDW